MKGIVAQPNGGSGTLHFETFPVPEINEYEVLVKINATALNRADLLQRAGHYPPPAGVTNILGLEMAGTIVKKGTKVTKYHIGDAVCGLLAGGGYAEYAKIHEEMAIPLRQNWDFEMAASIPEAFLTAYQALKIIGNIQADEHILIHAGASGVGSAAIQIAKAFGGQVYVTASKPKHPYCLEKGAILAIDYQHEDFLEVLRRKNISINLAIDFIGAPYFEKNIDILDQDGHLVILAFMGGQHSHIDLGKLLRKRVQITASTLRSRTLAYKIKLTKSFLADCAPFFEAGMLKPSIDRVFNWTAVEQAHQYMADNHNKGKIVLQVS